MSFEDATDRQASSLPKKATENATIEAPAASTSYRMKSSTPKAMEQIARACWTTALSTKRSTGYGAVFKRKNIPGGGGTKRRKKENKKRDFEKALSYAQAHLPLHVRLGVIASARVDLRMRLLHIAGAVAVTNVGRVVCCCELLLHSLHHRGYHMGARSQV